MQNKWLQYSALASGLLYMHMDASAQMVITDFNPDVLLFDGNQPEQYFDLNMDGYPDVGLDYQTSSSCLYCPGGVDFDIELFYGAEVATFMAPAMSLLSTFQMSSSFSGDPACYFPAQAVARGCMSGDIIDDALNFDAIDEIFNNLRCGSNGGVGQQKDIDMWESPGNPALKPFIGFRLPVGDGYQYGWLRLLSDADDKVWVTHMGIQLTPDAWMGIDTFHVTYESIESALVENVFTVYYTNGELHVSTHSAEPDMLYLYSMSGQLVYTSSYLQVAHSGIPFSEQKGMYIAYVLFTDGTWASDNFIIP